MDKAEINPAVVLAGYRTLCQMQGTTPVMPLLEQAFDFKAAQQTNTLNDLLKPDPSATNSMKMG